MATCNECLHVEVCKWSYLPPAAERCEDFKDKAQYVKIGADEPLTLDELRQMDGQPVWVQEVNKWAIVMAGADDDGEVTPFVSGMYGADMQWASFARNVAESGVHCYRHKPKEVSK